MKDSILKTLIATVILLSAIYALYALYYRFSPYENCMRVKMTEEASWNRKKAIILENELGEATLPWIRMPRAYPPACKKFQIIW